MKPAGAQKKTESNQKNVNVIRDNYFKLTGSEEKAEVEEHSIPASKTAMKNKPQPPSLYSQNKEAGGSLQ